jgi:decaprenylphospho-beta-D-ribofuranose 2-oxidase
MRRNTWANAVQPETINDLQELIASAIARHQTVVPRGGGHSYDAARNSNGMTLDLTLFRDILAWDREQGIITVEPGVTIDELLRTVVGSGWWPGVLPSKREATIGGCLALNACGANAWHAGSIGEYVSAFDLLLPTGEIVQVTPRNNDELFYSAIGGLGLLGVITSITLQLQPIRPGKLLRRRRFADSLSRMFDIFAEEAPREGFLTGWIDRYPREGRIGSGVVICGGFIEEVDPASPPPRTRDVPPSIAQLASSSLLERVSRLLFDLNTKVGNEMLFSQRVFDRDRDAEYIPIEQFHFPLSPVHYFLRNILSKGCYFFHPFVPARQAPAVFSRLLQLSQQSGFVPLWCIMRQHRSDAFVLSSQVDGFSLELAYPVIWHDEARFVHLLRAMLNQVIEAGGRLYLAQDRVLDGQTFKQMMGSKTIDRFLQIKEVYDRGNLFQSNLFRRLFR